MIAFLISSTSPRVSREEQIPRVEVGFLRRAFRLSPSKGIFLRGQPVSEAACSMSDTRLCARESVLFVIPARNPCTDSQLMNIIANNKLDDRIHRETRCSRTDRAEGVCYDERPRNCGGIRRHILKADARLVPAGSRSSLVGAVVGVADRSLHCTIARRTPRGNAGRASQAGLAEACDPNAPGISEARPFGGTWTVRRQTKRDPTCGRSVPVRRISVGTCG